MAGLTDRVVVVAGAAGNLGRVAVRELAADGARFGLLGSNLERLEAAAAELAIPADRVELQAADLRDGAAAERAIAAILARFGRIDVLVQAVGGWTGGTSLANSSPDDLRSMLDQHVWTTFNLLRAVIPSMTEHGWGRIVAVSAPAAVEPPARSAAYAAAKAGQEALIRSAARDLEGTGVTANVIVVRSIEAGSGKSGSRSVGTSPQEIVEAIRAICSPEASTTNGSRILLYDR